MPVIDNFAGQEGYDGPARNIASVTPSDSDYLTVATRAIMVSVGGDVKVTTVSGKTDILPALLAGVVYPVVCARIWSTGTTATGIKALW